MVTKTYGFYDEEVVWFIRKILKFSIKEKYVKDAAKEKIIPTYFPFLHGNCDHVSQN